VSCQLQIKLSYIEKEFPLSLSHSQLAAVIKDVRVCFGGLHFEISDFTVEPVVS
jgi:hypothetical protein